MTKQLIPGWYNTAAAKEVLGKISAAAISKIVKSEGWKSIPVAEGKSADHLHRAEDVHEYRDHQIRTRLVKALGWKGRGLYRLTDIDISCPICDGFAIQWPPPPYLPEKYLCINKHKGELQC